MPPETELIKQQMGQTRAALTDKLEALETKVLGTVNTTTDTVAQTVREVGATVRETAQDVRATVHETLSSVRDALDVTRQAHEHPWLLLGGSVAAGYVGGCLLDTLERGRHPSADVGRSMGLLPGETEPPARHSAASFFKALAETFAPELDKLKRAALGMAMGVMRDKISESVPPQMRENFTEMMDRVTVKLGGEPSPPEAMYGQGEESETNGARTAHTMK
jgi:ElaB/YqjD/DUF883 family membrane-anchored ribosome-binding protein